MSEGSTDPRERSRRLHGVLVADMTGFSKLMGEDEIRAVAALARIRQVFTAVVPRHNGTLDVFVGDCFVALFDSAVEAVHAAIAIQADLAGAGPAGDPLQIRIGIHLGDVVRSGPEILGDSVNIAARLQAVARPGSIAVSEEVYRAVRNRVSVPFRDLGPKALKNLREKIRVYELHVEDAAVGGAVAAPVWSMRRLVLAVMGILAVASLAALGYRLASQPPLLGLPALTPGTRHADIVPTRGAPLTVGVTGVSTHGEVSAWMQDNTRDGLNTLLSKVVRLRVFSREKIDFLRQRRGLSEIEVAETLGIQKMISGSLTIDGENVVVEARVVDTSTGILDASERVRGRPEDLIELQNQLASLLLAALGVDLSADERQDLFAQRTKDTLDGYRRLSDTFGEAPSMPSEPRKKKEATSWLVGPRPAWGQAPDAAESAIRTLLESYRTALERKDVDGVAATHVDLSGDQRLGFEHYFESADDLRVVLSDVDILIEGDEALVTFTRRDVFRDRKSGKEVQLEVRLSSEAVQKSGRWLLRGVKRS